MHSYEMIATADENGRTYVSEYGAYSKENGFDLRPSIIRNHYDVEDLLNKLLHEDCWRLKVDKKKMTKADIEKALGYEIDIVGDEETITGGTGFRTYTDSSEFLRDLFNGICY